MKAYELEKLLEKKGSYLVVAFGNIFLHGVYDKPKTIHPNIFRALRRDCVLDEECVQNGASVYTLKRIPHEC